MITSTYVCITYTLLYRLSVLLFARGRDSPREGNMSFGKFVARTGSISVHHHSSALQPAPPYRYR